MCAAVAVASLGAKEVALKMLAAPLGELAAFALAFCLDGFSLVAVPRATAAPSMQGVGVVTSVGSGVSGCVPPEPSPQSKRCQAHESFPCVAGFRSTTW